LIEIAGFWSGRRDIARSHDGESVSKAVAAFSKKPVEVCSVEKPTMAWIPRREKHEPG
jgi:hypothetical protein